jgi:hypothetical protein
MRLGSLVAGLAARTAAMRLGQRDVQAGLAPGGQPDVALRWRGRKGFKDHNNTQNILFIHVVACGTRSLFSFFSNCFVTITLLFCDADLLSSLVPDGKNWNDSSVTR